MHLYLEEYQDELGDEIYIKNIRNYTKIKKNHIMKDEIMWISKDMIHFDKSPLIYSKRNLRRSNNKRYSNKILSHEFRKRYSNDILSHEFWKRYSL